MATFEIFNDENVDSRNNIGNNRKSKRTDSINATKSNKRTALGNITNTRVQPQRAAKLKEKKSQEECPKNESFNDQTMADTNEDSCKKVTDTLSAFDKRKTSSSDACVEGSPMVLATPVPATGDFLIEVESDLVESSSTIEDIDLRSDINFGVREYAADIHTYIKDAELLHRPVTTYMKKQSDINANMRAILVDWLVEVAEEYKLLPQTLFLAVNYIDRFLSRMSVVRGKLQLVGTACMLVASKFEEIYPPEVSEFVYITDDTYTTKQVLRMEHLVLKTLAFDVSVPTILNFAQRYLLAANAEKDGQLQHLTNYLCELSLINVDPFIKYLPSQVAASSLYVASATLGCQSWTPTLEHYSGYCEADLMSCIQDIHTMFKSAESWSQQAIQNRYKSSRLGHP